VQTSGVPEQDTVPAETKAVLVKVPKRPKTKPAIAIDATSVIAISRTVARTGEIARLPPSPLDLAFILEKIDSLVNTACGS